MNDEKIILRPVYSQVILEENLDAGDGWHDLLTWEARFFWEVGHRSEDWRFFRGRGASQEEAVAELLRIGNDAPFMSCPCGRGDYAACSNCPYRSCPAHGTQARPVCSVEVIP
jgi:hypothetical protein